MPAELKYDITKACGVLSTSARGWTKELNYVSWNDRDPRLDLREWAPNHDRMGKGMTLSIEEAKALKEILNNLDI
ncbi:MAG: hypothetical protein IKB56_03115 [Clostridia bacterium]|nr:hypothetical protein [Clostridia bacterium]